MFYSVHQTIVSGNIDSGEPVEVNWYKGGSLPLAMSAMAQAISRAEDQPGVPASMRVHTLRVEVEFLADCPHRDQPMMNRPAWMRVPCSGQEVDTEVGTMCAAHLRTASLLGGWTGTTSACAGDECPLHNYSETKCDHEWEAQW